MKAATGKRSAWVRIDHPEAPVEIPLGVIRGKRPGPVFCVIAGVHGTEYGPVVASHRLFEMIDPAEVAGVLRFVFVANMPAFRARSPFVSPVDGKDLGRSFPGDPRGSHTEALAHAIWSEAVSGADHLVDMHSGEMTEDVVPFVIVSMPRPQSSEQADRVRSLASSFPVEYVLDASPDAKGWTPDGTAFYSAGALGVPSCMVEAGGQGRLDFACVDLLIAGVLEAMSRAGNISQREPGPETFEKTVLTDLSTVASRNPGVFVASVKAGDRVARGQPLGEVRSFLGSVLEQPRTPTDGVVVLLSSSPCVESGGTLAKIGVLHVATS